MAGDAHWDTVERNRDMLPKNVRPRLRLSYDFDNGGEIHRLSGAKNKPNPAIGPQLVIEPPYEHYSESRAERGEDPIIPIAVTSLFTTTGKMACPSWSIPAGPRQFKGTCPASVQESVESEAQRRPHAELSRQFDEAPDYQHVTKTRTTTHPPRYLCRGCYAGRGNYARVPLTAIRQYLHLRWLEDALEADRRGKRGFTFEMIAAIRYMRLRPQSEAQRAGFNTNFFRIHDSGDFHKTLYYDAWMEICRNFLDREHYVYFWAPTRQWVFKEWREHFLANPPPSNCSIRPSALFFGAPPPDLDFLAMGSSSARDPMGSLGHTPPSRRPREDEIWDCPAYEKDEADEKNCASVRCRVCWTHPHVAVSYREH